MSIHEYQTDGGRKWLVSYTLPNGRRTKKRGFQTKKAARDWEALNTVRAMNGETVVPALARTKMGVYIDKFLEEKGSRAETTLSTREYITRKWVAPMWGNWAVSRVTAAAITEWLEEMSDDGAKADTRQKALRYLRGALSIAVREQAIAKNPAVTMDTGRPEVRRRTYLTHRDVAELANIIDPRFRLFVGVLAYTGLRIGELAGLTVGDFDAPNNRFFVQESATLVRGTVVKSSPKNGRSRPVAYPAFLSADINAMLEGKSPSAYVFTAPQGGILRHDLFRKRYFRPAFDELNRRRLSRGEPEIAYLTPRDMRNTAARLMIDAGANVTVVQAVLGHSSAKITLDLYAGLFRTDVERAAEALDEAAGDNWGEVA